MTMQALAPDLSNVEGLRRHLMDVVTLYNAMFQRLLFENPALPPEVGELFEDAGNTYLDFAERISLMHAPAQETDAS